MRNEYKTHEGRTRLTTAEKAVEEPHKIGKDCEIATQDATKKSHMK